MHRAHCVNPNERKKRKQQRRSARRKRRMPPRRTPSSCTPSKARMPTAKNQARHSSKLARSQYIFLPGVVASLPSEPRCSHPLLGYVARFEFATMYIHNNTACVPPSGGAEAKGKTCYGFILGGNQAVGTICIISDLSILTNPTF